VRASRKPRRLRRTRTTRDGWTICVACQGDFLPGPRGVACECGGNCDGKGTR